MPAIEQQPPPSIHKPEWFVLSFNHRGDSLAEGNSRHIGISGPLLNQQPVQDFTLIQRSPAAAHRPRGRRVQRVLDRQSYATR